MEIVVSHAQSRVPVVVFHVSGRLDAATHAQLVQQARAAYDAGMRHLVIDLSECSFISSAALQAIHKILIMLRTAPSAGSGQSARRAAGKGSGKSPYLKLCGASPSVREVLSIVGYDGFMDLYPSLGDALGAFDE
ncbi:MAG: STAS domain-containing protein [Chloroflexi bacterium]|nr:STAS domain-containing protein [Chloroflexota bacterium]MBI3732516.1 STAS domain-containing protein [Chloroflexota bacterium]